MPRTLTVENYDEHINKTTNAIIDFSAEWCGPCQRLKPYFAKAEGFVQDKKLEVKFFEVDVNESEELAEKYNIRCMPTILLIKNGEVVERRQGFMDDIKILELIGSRFDLPKEEQNETSVGEIKQNNNLL
jgi:thioredoxin 1